MAKKELLAPVGSYEAMIAAVNAGCDAIYTGGRLFGARAFANNFNNEELIEAINYCHLHNVAVYLTVNTLLSDAEIEEYLFDYIKPLYEAGLDAVIVQDIGVLNYIGTYFPELPIHLSTQFTSTTHYSTQLFEKYNITRVVTPRELSLAEIALYSKNTKLEIETFIHGALCYCYSGQCLMSALVGGRSGNRGKCAQPCRKEYYIDDKDKSMALLSLKDLCTIDLLPELMESNIYSFKIEGRMKKPEYAYTVVAIYRKYMDLYEKLGSEKYKKSIINSKEYYEDKIKLSDIYNRGGFTTGYMKEHNSKSIACTELVSHYGTPCGKVSNVSAKEFSFTADIILNSQDVLQIRNDRQQLVYEFTLKDIINKGGYYKGRYQSKTKLQKNMVVYRVRNNSLLNDIGNSIRNNKKRIPITMKAVLIQGEAIVLTLNGGGCSVEVTGGMCEMAVNAPVSKDNIIEKLRKIGNTEFVCDDIDVVIEGNVFVLASCVNELRREGIEKLKNAICDKKKNIYELEKYKKYYNKKSNKIINHEQKLMVYCMDYKTAEVVVKYPERFTLILEEALFTKNELTDICKKAKKHGKRVCIALPWILRYKDEKSLEQSISVLNLGDIDSIMIRSFDELMLLKNINTEGIQIIGDSSLYAYNTLAINELYNMGIDIVTSPLEQYNPNADVITIYGDRPVMVSASCVKKTLEKCNQSEEVISFSNEKGDRYFSKAVCKYCYNTVFSDDKKYHYDISQMIKKGHILRVNFTTEDEKAIYSVLKRITVSLNNKE